MLVSGGLDRLSETAHLGLYLAAQMVSQLLPSVRLCSSLAFELGSDQVG